MPYLASKRFVLLTISLVAVALLLSLHSASAQGNVLGGSPTGAEAQTGLGAAATGVQALAAGVAANASGLGAIAIGTDSNAGGVSATASGVGSIAIGGDTITPAQGALATTIHSIAIGDSSRATGVNGSVAIGPAASATGERSIAITADGGFPASASGNFAVVIGDNSSATNTEGLSVGTNLTNTGAFATNIGNNNSVTGLEAVAVGTSNSASGSDSGVFGAFSTASGASSYAIGAFASATATNALALGSGTSAGFTNSTAIGAGATTTRANQMSFGTATNTYTMAGITSAASSGAQTGPTQFVTTDLNGNLAAFNLQPVFGKLRNRIENTRNQEQGGIALAIATANLRYDDRPGKISVAGGMGGFQHEAGGSLGLGYTAPNQRVRFNVSAGGSTHGDFGGGGGLSFTLN